MIDFPAPLSTVHVAVWVPCAMVAAFAMGMRTWKEPEFALIAVIAAVGGTFFWPFILPIAVLTTPYWIGRYVRGQRERQRIEAAKHRAEIQQAERELDAYLQRGGA